MMKTTETSNIDSSNPSESTYEFSIELPPVPASRPRVGKFGTYYTQGYANWKKQALAFFPGVKMELSGLFTVDIDVICKRPAKVTRLTPVGDVDNYAKAALDVVTSAGVWSDDDAVTSSTVSKRYAEPEELPRTIIRIKHRKN